MTGSHKEVCLTDGRGELCVKSNIVNNLCKDMVYTF